MPPRFHNKGTLQKKEKRKKKASTIIIFSYGQNSTGLRSLASSEATKGWEGGVGGGRDVGGGCRGAGGETGQPASDERHGRQLKARMATLRRRRPHSPNNYCFCNAGNPPPPPLPPAIPPPSPPPPHQPQWAGGGSRLAIGLNPRSLGPEVDVTCVNGSLLGAGNSHGLPAVRSGSRASCFRFCHKIQLPFWGCKSIILLIFVPSSLGI